ncbi:MAG: NUDIX hydrolase [Chthoniobacteraceae bacterium]|nr:NUDIX hydrolase [Chthoniobacteraceae bacterium]
MRFHDLHQNAPGWQTLEDTEAFANPYAAVHLVKVKTPMRPEGARWTVIHRKAACVIAPITPEGNLLLIRQERIPVRAALWELPAGQIDDGGAPGDAEIRAAALREMREEAGCLLAPEGQLTPLGFFFSSPGILDEQTFLFAASPVVPCPDGPAHEESEAIAECRAFTPAELRERIASGEIRDANTLAVFARMTALGML